MIQRRKQKERREACAVNADAYSPPGIASKTRPNGEDDQSRDAEQKTRSAGDAVQNFFKNRLLAASAGGHGCQGVVGGEAGTGTMRLSSRPARTSRSEMNFSLSAEDFSYMSFARPI